jgi:hypothetical protein
MLDILSGMKDYRDEACIRPICHLCQLSLLSASVVEREPPGVVNGTLKRDGASRIDTPDSNRPAINRNLRIAWMGAAVAERDRVNCAVFELDIPVVGGTAFWD